MKKTILILALLGFNAFFGQETPKKVTLVNNGVRGISPSHTIEKKDDNTIQIFEVTNNIKEITPTKEVLKTNDGKVEIYNVNNGVRDLTPTLIIED